MSVLIQLTDAVVAKLNEGVFSESFVAVRHYRPTHELAELRDLKVSVVPKSIESSVESRELCAFDYAIDVGVQKRVTPNTPAEIDALLSLVQEIDDALRMVTLTWPVEGDEDMEAAWIASANEPVYAPDHLAEHHVFTSVLTITYRIWR